MATPRDHIEEIRKKKFSIGGEPNPLIEDLHEAVKNLSVELYAKDVHFIMELVQNAEDNEYQSGVHPSLEFIITSKDITATGSSSTLLIFNNEKGFSRRNIDSICSVGRSTKKGKRECGYVGEKGIGFKSVFLVTSQPYIFSNGYQIRFNEDPNPECKIGYVVPEWVDENPTLLDIQQIYGSSECLPTTTIILPLKSEKVGAVKQQLSSLHPEVLLFLSKIKRLSIKEENPDSRPDTVSSISISSETDFKTRKNIDAESYTLHLSVEESSDAEKECRYHMWKQKFAVRQECRVERRMEIDEWVITLAFPFGERLGRKQLSSPGVYAFLPTEMVTNLPFVIQADFVLASSRETIQLDNKWNRGILDCVPSAFISALVSSVKTTEAPPLTSLVQWFEFLPVKTSPYPELNTVRNKIQEKLIAEHIIPCESYTQQLVFSKPNEVSRLLQSFWKVLNNAKEPNRSLQSISSYGTYILNSAFDRAQYDEILNFLGIKFVGKDWYAKFIQSSNLLLGISDDVYIELLCFLADNWTWIDSFQNIPILKCCDQDGKIGLWSSYRTKNSTDSIYVSSDVDHIAWLMKWSREFRCAGNVFFMPESTQKALKSFSQRETVMYWLQKHASAKVINVYGYGNLLVNGVTDRRLVIALTHFLYHSFKKSYLSDGEVRRLCASMQIVDNYGYVVKDRRGVLIPAKGSKWMELMGSNPWRGELFVELTEDYIRAANHGGVHTSENELLQFLETYIKALDIPEVCPPNAEFPAALSALPRNRTFLLLDWLKNLRYKGVRMPEKFLRCVKEGNWLKTGLGYKPPSESFLPSSGWGKLLQMGSVLVDIPLIDEKFYGNEINSFKEELRMIGVMFESKEACKFIANRLMSLAGSCRLTRGNVVSMLKFLKFLRENYLHGEEFINNIKDKKWLKTSIGERSPVGSILFDSEWEVVSQISSAPFINKEYYGQEIRCYSLELQSLGVLVGFNHNYKLVTENFNLSKFLANLKRETVLMILKCIQQSGSSVQLVRELRDQCWLKTNLGYKAPAKSFLCDPQWGCLLDIIGGVPLIDENYYGADLRTYKNELKQMGVVVDFDDASKAVSNCFKQALFSSSLGRENVFSLLHCYRHLKAISHRLPRELISCISEEKWLRTRLGNRSPKESILFGPEWKSISPIAQLAYIDDTYYGERVYTYRDELKALGVVFEFNKGCGFIARGLNLPENPIAIDPASVLSLLECIRLLRTWESVALPNELINKKWLKTHSGYRSPKECLLFDSKWESFLQREDGPFIDEAFYGNKILPFKEELKGIGVVVEVENGCQLLASHLGYHSQLPVIARIYKYLSKFNWEPYNKSNRWIWIPNGSDKGAWTGPEGCVTHDKDNLFGLRLKVLEKYYNDKEILGFFSSVLGVPQCPKTEDYCNLWKDWENGHHLKNEECRSFWEYIGKQWSSRTEKIVIGSMSKLPVNTKSGGIRLCNKKEVFIPDDLLLKDLFEKASEPIFVWYPQPSLPSLSASKLYEIYRSIGVRTISESITKANESYVSSIVEFQKMKKSDGLIKEGLLMIILGYLAHPSFEMPADQRHGIAKPLLGLMVSETVDPITSSYCLPLSSGKTISAKASKMVRWERESSWLLVQKFDGRDQKAKIEFATQFSEAISGGLLWHNTDRIADLCELIKLGCLLEFEVDAVRFLLKTKNLQLFVEDAEFLASTFPYDLFFQRVIKLGYRM